MSVDLAALAFRVSGTAGFLDTLSTDGRLVEAGGFVLPDERIPLMGIYMRYADGFGGHEGARIVGWLDRVWAEGSRVRVEGRCDNVAPGTYPCGMDVAGVQSQLVMADGEPYSWLRVERGDDFVERFTGGRLIAVTMYLPASGQNPSFPGSELTVEAAA